MTCRRFYLVSSGFIIEFLRNRILKKKSEFRSPTVSGLDFFIIKSIFENRFNFGQIRSDDVDTPYIQRQHCQIFRFLSEINLCNLKNVFWIFSEYRCYIFRNKFRPQWLTLQGRASTSAAPPKHQILEGAILFNKMISYEKSQYEIENKKTSLKLILVETYYFISFEKFFYDNCMVFRTEPAFHDGISICVSSILPSDNF